MLYPWLVLLQSLLLYQNYLSQAAMVRPTGIECESNDLSFGTFVHCKLKPISRDVQELHIELKVKQKPINNLTLRYEIRGRSHTYSPLYSKNLDFCAFLENKRRFRLANISYNFFNFGKYSNLNHSCPLDHDIIMNGSRFDRNTTLFLPIDKGYYTLWSYWQTDNILRATINVKLQVE